MVTLLDHKILIYLTLNMPYVYNAVSGYSHLCPDALHFFGKTIESGKNVQEKTNLPQPNSKASNLGLATSQAHLTNKYRMPTTENNTQQRQQRLDYTCLPKER